MCIFRKFILLPAFLLLLLSSVLQAQYDLHSSWIMAEEGRGQQIFFGTKVLVGVDLKFSNLGEMPYIQGDEATYTYEFNDGYINVPHPNGDFTSEFGFFFQNATEGADGNVDSFTLSRYRSASIGESHDADLDFSTGWELGSRYDMWKLNNRLTVGFTVAGGFTPLRETYSTTVKGELYKQTVTIPISGPGIAYQDSGLYNGGPYGGTYILLDDLNFDPDSEARVTQVLSGGDVIQVDSQVEGFYQLNGGMATFRTGTYLDIYLTERLLLHFGIGLSASYLSYDFTVDQSLITSTLSSTYRIASNINDGQWLVGAYAELNMIYRFNQKTSIYVGAQTHFISDFDDRELDDTVMELNMGSPTQLQAGFEFDF